jgi:chloramphenicol O-acetyltransferase type A
MKKTIDIANWKRREHFEFFSALDEPFHGLVVDLDCTRLRTHCTQLERPFFLGYLHKILQTVNATESFRQRIENNAVVEYEQVHSNVTVSRPDSTFGFCSVDFDPEFARFVTAAQSAMDRVRNSSGLGFNAITKRTNEIHFSVLPDIRFTGLTHARRLGPSHGEPKISVGQVRQENQRWTMPIAVFVHHGLVDGQHVAAFLQHAQHLFDSE